MRAPLVKCLAWLSVVTFVTVPPALSTASAAGVEQFVDDQTVLAGEIDLTRVDPAAVETFLFDAAKAARIFEPGPGAAQEKEVRQSLAKARDWIAGLKANGAKTIYLTGNVESLKIGPPTVIVPVPDEKSATVASLLYSGKPDGATGPRTPQVSRRTAAAETVPGVGAVLGNAVGRTYVKTLKPQPRADVQAALQAAGDAPMKAVFAPDAKARAQMQKVMPPQLMNQPTALLWRDLKWATLSATVPPKPTLKLLVQSANAQTAKQTGALVNAAIAVVPLRAPQLTPEQIRLLTPAVQNDQLVLSLDEKQVATLATALGPPLREARLSAMRTASMSNMRQLLLGVIMSARDNKGQWPDDLSAIEKYLGGKEKAAAVMTNPARPQVKPAYVYVKPADANPANPGTTMVLYESHTDFGRGVSVGFADGHVEYVSDRARFERLLAGDEGGPAVAPVQ
jgi:prepilin-type processing-associated H-X9-DG protein